MTALHVTAGVDPQQLAQVYADSRIVAALSRDGNKPQPLVHPLVKYWSAWIEGRFAGAFMTVRQSVADVEVHSLLLRSARRYSRALAAIMMRTLFADPQVRRLTAWVCSDLSLVINFLRRLGFTLEGVRREACSRDGYAVDALMFGLLRPDWSAKWAL